MEIYHAEPFGLNDLSVTQYLEFCLNGLSTLEPSTGSFDLCLSDVCITPTVISLLLQILNHPLPREHTQNDDDSKWDSVWLQHCYVQPPPSLAHTQEDLNAFFSTLLARTKELALYNDSIRPQAFDFFTRCPQLEQMELNSLKIDEYSSFPFDYLRLGNTIQRSTHLTDLNLSLPFGRIPHEMFESLSNAINLQRLCLRAAFDANDEHDQILPHLVGDGGASGAVARLLQNPQSRLQQLELRRMRLRDRHFSAIVRLLPSSNLKLLDVSYNNIQSLAILEVAEQLPRIKSLQTMILLPNPWLPPSGQCSDVEAAEECCTALVQGMMKNYSVEKVLQDPYDPSTFEGNLQTRLLMHVADLNQAGRRILVASSVVPLGLWPHILERAGTTNSYPSRAFETLRARVIQEQAERKANVVFYLLRNSPIFTAKQWFQQKTIR